MADIKTNQAKLYKALQGVGFKDLGSEEQFAAKLQDAGNREKLYKALQKQGFKDLGDYGSFENKIYEAATQPTPAPQPTPQPTQPTPQQTQQKSKQESAKDAVTGKPLSPYLTGEGATGPFMLGAPEFEASYDIGNGKKRKVNEDIKLATSGKFEPAKMQYVNEKGDVVKEEDIYPIEPQEVAYDNYLKETGKQPTIEQQNQQRLDKVNKELADQVAKEERAKNNALFNNWPLFINQAINMAGSSAPGASMDYAVEESSRRKLLEARQNLLTEGRNIIQEVRREANEGDGVLTGIKQGLRNTAIESGKKSTWDFGATEINTQSRILDAIIRMDNGEALTEDERDLLNDFALKNAIDQRYNDQLSGWAKAGQVTGDAFGYMFEMLVNPANKIAGAVRKGAMKYAVKKYGREYVEKRTKSLMAKMAATKTAGTIAGILGGGATMAATTGALKTVANAEERMQGQVLPTQDEQGNIAYGGHEKGDDALTAFSKALASQTFEYGSEMAGEYLPALHGFFGNMIGKAVVGKKGRQALKLTGDLAGVNLNRAQKFIYDVSAGKGIAAFNKGLDKFLKQTEWHGPVSEYEEEVLNNLANVLTGDTTFDAAENTGVFNPELNLETFCGVAFMGGGISAFRTGKYAYGKIKNSEAKIDAANQKLFGDDWNTIRESIQVSADDTQALNNVLTDILDSADYDKKQKKAALDYAAKVLEGNGAEMAMFKPRMAGSYVVQHDDGSGYTVLAMDKKGEVLQMQTFKTEDEAKAFQGELKMQQQSQDFKDYLKMSNGLSYQESTDLVNEFFANVPTDEELAAVQDPSTPLGKSFQEYKLQKRLEKAEASQAAIAAFEKENGWEPGTVKWLSEQDPMHMDSATLQMADQAREFLKGLAYPSTEVHTDIAEQEGAETAENVVEQVVSTTEAIDPNDNEGQRLLDSYKESETALNSLFERNEDLKVEYERLQGMGFSPQEIVSQLDSFSREDVQTVVDYLNADARYKSYMNTAAKKIDEEAHNSRERHTFKGTINGNPDKTNVLTITDGTNTYTLVSGNITTNSQGEITGSDSGLIIGLNEETGEFVQLSDTSGYTVGQNAYDLDTFEQMERARLQQLVTMVSDPTGSTMQPAADNPALSQNNEGVAENNGAVPQNGEVGGEAGVANDAGANEPSTPQSAVAKFVSENDIIPIFPFGKMSGSLNIDGGVGAKRVAKQMLQMFKSAANWEELRDKITQTGWSASVNNMTHIKNFFESYKRGEISDQEVEALFDRGVKLETTPTEPAINRIPKDEGGNLVYEQASPEDTYDALVEQVGEQSAKVLAKKQIDDATKNLARLQKQQEKGELKGKTIQEQIAEMQELQAAIDAEHGKINYWNSVLAVPNNRRLNEVKAPVVPAAAPKNAPAETGGEGNVPDWSVDKASDARARGYRMTNGHRVDRQQPITDKVEGNDVEVKFDKNEEPAKGKIVVVDSKNLVPSHVNGQRNVLFFIDEAQPKDRTDVDSDASSTKIARDINPEEITGGVTAYTGSPVINERGEVIQGNNRTIGLQKMWGSSTYGESQQKYKQYLIDHSAEFGLDPDEIAAMQSPVLVRMIDVNDDEAIRLGQKTAANTESGGIERIDPMRVIQQMGDNVRIFMDLLFGQEIEGQTLMGMIVENGVDVLKWLNDGRNHPKYITDTQYQSCFDKKGNLTEEAKADLRKIVEGMLFADAPDRLPEMFYNMPAKAQNAILSTFWRDAQSTEDAKIIKDIQSAIEAFAVISGVSEQFRSAKDVNAARVAVKDVQRQTQMFGNTGTVLEKFSNFALELAIRFKGDKQNTIRDYFNGYFDAVQGKGGTLFEPASTKTKAEAINDIFGIDINEKENGEEGSNTLGSNGENGQAGQQGGTTGTGNGESVEGGEQPATGGTGSNGGAVSEREQYIADHPLTIEEIDAANASYAQKVLAKQYLNLNDDHVSEMAKAAYTFIYNKKVAAQNQGQQGETKPQAPSKPRSEAPARPQTPQQPETPPTPPSTGEQGGTQNAAQAAAKAKMAAALAKLKKHGKKSDNNTDAYSIENLTPEQIEDMFEVVEAGAELGYTLLDGVQTKEEWIAQMREAIAEPLKDATGYNDTEVDELLNDMWNYPYEVEGQAKTVSEWAAEKGININEIEDGTEEGNGGGDNPSAELPGSNDVGGSTETEVEPGNNNEGNPESAGEAGFGPLFGGGSQETGTGEQTTGKGQRTGSRGTNSGETGNTGSRGESEDNGGTRKRGERVNDTGGTVGGRTKSVQEVGGSVGRNSNVESKPKEPLADITQEKAPYQPASTKEKKFAIGSVIPSGIADAIAKAFERLKKMFKKNTIDFVREELGYKTNEEMLSTNDGTKDTGLAAEQVDAVALAISKMKEGKSFIVGDMTGVGKGRTAAALIRWGIKHGKKVLFVTEKSGLFSDMYRDMTDIGSDYMPFVTNADADANITDSDGNKVIPKPMLAAQKALWQSGSDKLPRDKKGRQYDFVMTTYSQVSSTEKGDQQKKEWLKEYAKDAIVIMDESHNASGESNTGRFFREIVQQASGVTFLSATYAKRPDNMLIYAIKSSMSELNMAVGDMLEAIKEYGVAMQEMMASAFFGSGEMIRRERDMSGVKTTWTDPRVIYSEEEFEQCRKTSDKTMALIEDIIQFQRDYVNPIVKAHEKDFDGPNQIAAKIGAPMQHASNTAYKSQVSNLVGLMVYSMKAKKAAQMAIEQIKQGKKPVIAVDNTMESYIRELGDEIDDVNFKPIFEKGIRFSLKYMIATYAQDDTGKYKKVKGSEQYFNAEDELDDDGLRALENLRSRVLEYLNDNDKIDLTLSPIDMIKQMIADAGYKCGEITGRSFELEPREGGGYLKKSFKANKKDAARKFNGGSKDRPIPEDEQYQALVLNVAGATGISLHSSKKFGNQQPRTMIILQPAKDVNTEVQMRGRIDRTNQAHRGEYFYVSSPIPAEQKIMMMLKQKLASLDAQSVGTKDVSSNKVDSQDMDNKYGDQVCKDFLLEHMQDINALLEDGLQYNNKTREWEGRPGLLYDVLKNIQRLPCDMQEMIINELAQRYADQINYLNQNGINDLETTTMDLEAVTIDKATFVKGKDNESVSEFAHDTTIERVEVNVLKKPMRSSDIKKKMKDLDALDEDGLPKGGILEQTTKKVKETIDNLFADREAKYAEKEQKLEEKLRKEHPKKEQTEEQYEEMIQNWPSLQEMKNKNKADLMTYGANLQEQYNNIYKAAMYLKPGRPYLVPLTDDVGGDAPMMYGRFLGFQIKNGDPRQVQAVFAVKDSRSMITIPVVNQMKAIDKILQERNDIDIVSLQKNEYGEDLTQEETAKVWDEWWDKMIPKNTNRQIRYMITGNVVQACGSLGKYKGQIVTFTRKNKDTGEVTVERGMLLAENFDPENFKVRKAVEKKDIWDSYGEVKDERSGISCYREGSHMVVKFDKRKGEKLTDHPAQKDETLKGLIMNGELRPSKKDIMCVVKEENVEKALEHLYREYGYTKEELFVMPDSTEKPDAIVHTNRPYKEIIEELKDKYGGSYWMVDSKIKKMLKRYKMDVNNDQMKEEIKEAVMLRQAYLRKRYANQESNRLAWQVLIQDQMIERYKDDKELREEHQRIKEAILEELEYRGFKGKAYHYTQGKLITDDVKKMFDEMNDESTPEGKAKKMLFDKVMAKVSKLPMEIFMNEKLDNDTGGWAGGRLVNYNWKYMNADYISDQAKADTILHELIHTVTAYADRCVEDGYEHLLDQDMIDAINELHSIFDAIKNDPTFVHDGEKAYGLTNVREMLSEAGSNSEFRDDLKKTGLWARLKAGFLAFFGIKQNVQGGKQVNAFEQIMERLDYLIENFKQEAWEEYYKGTQYGGYGYKKRDSQKATSEDPLEAMNQAAENWRNNMSDRAINSIVESMKDNASVAPVLEATKENWMETVSTPIGNVKMGENQKEKLFDKKRNQQYGMMLETLSNPDIILEEMDSESDSSHERPSSYLFVKTFKKPDGTKYVHFESVTVSQDGMEVSISSHIIRENQLKKKLKSDRLLYKATALDKSANSSAEQPINDGGSHSSVGKDMKKNNTSQEKKKKNGNINNSDPIDAMERAADGYMDGLENNPMTYSAKEVYNERLNRVETVFSEAYQDAMVSLKTAQNAIAGDEDIPDSQNAYQAENLMHGKNKNETDLFNEEYRDPLIDTINKIMNLTGMNWGDVDRYVYTKSGLERNREFYVRDWLEAQRKRTIRKYEDLNPEEQDIYAEMEEAIEDLFEAGDIDEAEKNKRLKTAIQKAHLRYIDNLEKEWQETKDSRYLDLLIGNSPSLGIDNFTYADYLAALDRFITDNIDGEFDPSEHDYSGFRAMFGDENGEYDEAEIIDDLMNQEDMIGKDNLDVLWGQINAATRYGLERYRQAGMRSDEQIDSIEKMFHFYVPMRGFKDDTGEDMYQYFTGKASAKSYIGGLLKHAKGRGSEANYPISTIFAMTYKAIADCNQNLVNQKLYRLCQANPNDLIILSDSWAVAKEDPATGETVWEEAVPNITDDMDEEDVRQATKDYEEEMRSLAEKGKAKRIRGKAHFDYKPMDKRKQSEHIVDVRINGDKKQMVVVSNPRMAQALNGQLRFEVWFSKVNAKIKNVMASLFTSYWPTFALRNMARDWTHFRTMLGVREGHTYAAAASKYYRQSLFKMVSLFKKYREGTLDMDNEMERDFKDFMDNGGVTGFVQMNKVEDIQKQMEKLYKQQKEGKAVKLNNKIWDISLGAIEALNEGIENNARFATFRASRHVANRTKQRSAYDAKEITVNFNRKGAGRKTAGFKSQNKRVEDAAKAFGITSQVLGEGKIFFNATIQAIATTFKNFQNPDGSLNKPYIARWATKYALPPFMFGFMLPYINQMLAAALGGDGDDDPYANLPEWTRRKNICIYAGKHDGHDYFITIPIGQELAAFLALGDIAAGNTYAPDMKPVDRGWNDEMIGVLGTFSPVDVDTKITKGGLTEDPVDEVVGRTFSVLAPLVAVGQNIGWTGRPIYREDKFGTDQYTPEYQMVYSGTNPVLVNTSKLLNDLSGGDDVTRGKIQVNPAIIQYLWEQYSGGPGEFVSNTISVGKDAKDILTGNESEFNLRKVEGLKAFVQQSDDRTQYYRTQAKYRKYLEDAKRMNDAVNGYMQAASTDPMALPKLEKISASEDYVRMKMVLEAEKSLSKINKAANKAEGKQRRELRQLYNRQVNEVVKMLDSVGEE